MADERIFYSRFLHAPKECDKCGSVEIKYTGVGEYECENCRNVMYDDFGRVRNYLEEHRGATQSQVARDTGVAMETIRQFLREERLEVVDGSGVFMHCDLCNAPIRSGIYCPSCAAKIEQMKKEQKAMSHNKNMQGYGKALHGEDGARRFKR